VAESVQRGEEQEQELSENVKSLFLQVITVNGYDYWKINANLIIDR